MSRRDTILIAVIINTGLLAILFATAVIYDPMDKILEQSEVDSKLAENRDPLIQDSSSSTILSNQTTDEVDHVLNAYRQQMNSYVALDHSTDVFINEPVLPTTQSMLEIEEDTPPEELLSSSSIKNTVEIVVKKGDVLEKIARANGTTVTAIKKMNQLQGERLQIGQVLKVPGKKDLSQTLIAEALPVKKPDYKDKEIKCCESQYYVIRSGDNPWKIARQFNVKFEEILRLNQLDEASARNLKVGDRIRVK